MAEDPTPIPEYRSALRAAALQALDAARRAGPLFCTASEVISADGVTVRLVVTRGTEGQPLPRLRPSEWTILWVLGFARERWTGGRILDELQRRDKPMGESTMKQACARLVDLNLIDNNKVAPQGYRVTAEGQAIAALFEPEPESSRRPA
jgi:hypothetical protein